MSSSRIAIVWLLGALLLTAVVTRVVTRRIRAGSTGLRNWEIGGIHVHHQVFGIILVMLSGFIEFAYEPHGAGLYVLAALFGVGAALTLDEFALWLYLDDVYWSPEGRKSIDAIVIAITIAAFIAIGAAPLSPEGTANGVQLAVVVDIAINLALSIITFLKGKPMLGVMSIFLLPCGVVGAIRLAKPDSYWARRMYAHKPDKLARAEKRFGPDYVAKWNGLKDRLGGL
jgi:hypothetical protein